MNKPSYKYDTYLRIHVLCFPKSRNLEPFFKFLQNKRGHGYKNQIIKPDDQKNLCIPKGPGGNDLAFAGQLDTGYDIGQR